LWPKSACTRLFDGVEPGLIDRLADPAVSVITLTITEKPVGIEQHPDRGCRRLHRSPVDGTTYAFSNSIGGHRTPASSGSMAFCRKNLWCLRKKRFILRAKRAA